MAGRGKCEADFLERLGDETGETKDVLKEIADEAEVRAEDDPSRTFAQHYNDIINEMEALDRASQSDVIKLETTMAARDSLKATFESMLSEERRGATGSKSISPATAVSRTVEAAGNDVMQFQGRESIRFTQQLEDQNIERFFIGMRKDRQGQIDVLKEVGELNKRNGQPGITNNKNALKVAKLYQQTMDRYHKRLDTMGIKVGYLEGRMLKQVWNSNSLRTFGTADDFVRAIAPRLDIVKTFGKSNVKSSQVKKFLKEFYRRQVAGVETEVPLQSRHLVRERQTYASQREQSREVHLKSAEDTLYVMENFGEGDVGSAMFSSVANTARRVRISENFGINPRNTLEFLRRHAKKGASESEARDIDNPTLRNNMWDGNPEAMMEVIDGSFDVAGSVNLRLFEQSLLNLTRAAFLQRVLLSSIPDVATTQRAYARIGGTVSEGVAKRFDAIFKDLDPDTARLMAGSFETANAYNMGMMLQRANGRGPLVKVANTSSWLSNNTMKYSGQNLGTRHNKRTAWMMSNSLISRLVDVSYEDLDVGVRGLMRRSRIDKAGWDKIRSTEGVIKMVQEHRFMDADAVKRIDGDLGERLETVFQNFADDAVPTPGIRERAILTQGQRAGTITGTMLRIVTSLLGYPVTFMTRQMAREAELGGARGITGQMMLGASTTFMGYLSMMAHDLAQGRVRDYTTDDVAMQRDFLLEALTRGGAGGIVGGELINMVRFGDGVGGLFAGAPTSVLDNLVTGLAKTGQKAWEGEYGEAGAIFLESMRTNVGFFTNLPQTKLAIDAALYNPLMQMADPEKLRRAERNWEKRTGGRYLLSTD